MGSTETTIGDPPVVPLVDDIDSQFPALAAAAVNGTDELGLVVTERFWLAGTDRFTELNVNDDGVATRVKVAGLRSSVTFTGTPAAPAGVMVMVPL